MRDKKLAIEREKEKSILSVHIVKGTTKTKYMIIC
jgi:hypothetical protein